MGLQDIKDVSIPEVIVTGFRFQVSSFREIQILAPRKLQPGTWQTIFGEDFALNRWQLHKTHRVNSVPA
jgi:hypothetical protein